jgi:hypothetical protein
MWKIHARRCKMYVERSFWNVKMGCMDETIKLCLSVKPWFDEKHIPIRLYSSWAGPNNVMCYEGEYESLAEYVRLSKEWNDSKECVQMMLKFRELTERGGNTELWEVFK